MSAVASNMREALARLDRGDAQGAREVLAQMREAAVLDLPSSARANGSMRSPGAGGSAWGGEVATYREQAFAVWREWQKDKTRKLFRRPVPLLVTHTTSTATGTLYDNFRVPVDYAFFVEDIRGTLRMDSMTGETLAVTGIGNPNLVERCLMKAMNARISLSDEDDTFPLIATTDNASTLALSDVLIQVGGDPIVNVIPDLVPPGHRVRMGVTRFDTTAAIGGAATKYGLVLTGTFVRVPAS